MFRAITRVSRAVPRLARVAPLTAAMPRYYASNAENRPKSVLNDDLLAQVGIDADDAKTKPDADKPRKKNKRQTTNDLKRERLAKFMYLGMLSAGLLAGGYMVRDWDEDEDQRLAVGEKPIPNGYSPLLMYRRFGKRWSGYFSYFTEPLSEKLLPDVLSPEFQRPLTLVVALEDFLVHSEWSAQYGWRSGKRAGLEYFLLYLSLYYEIVLFSKQFHGYIEPTLKSLDPHQALFAHRLARENAVTTKGKIIKDLSRLNRDLGKVVMLDPDPEHYSYQPENALPVEKWDGQLDDKLIQYIPFLEWLAVQPNLKDVRPIIASYKNTDDFAAEFAKREAKLRENYNQEWHEKHKNGNAGSWASKLLGLPVDDAPKFPLDTIRERGQAHYRDLKKFIDDAVAKDLEERKKFQLSNEKEKFTLGKMLQDGVPAELGEQASVESSAPA